MSMVVVMMKAMNILCGHVSIYEVEYDSGYGYRYTKVRNRARRDLGYSGGTTASRMLVRI